MVNGMDMSLRSVTRAETNSNKRGACIFPTEAYFDIIEKLYRDAFYGEYENIVIFSPVCIRYL